VDREILLLREFEQLRYAEISEVLRLLVKSATMVCDSGDTTA
jgi:DNA-directed RNA polymerase specialized sigma24 family protein